MSTDDPDEPDAPPWGQRLLDRPFLLLFLGMAVMFVFYTGWGTVELLLLPTAKLP